MSSYAWFPACFEFWSKASLASISMDASTIWTPTLIPASSDVDACSGHLPRQGGSWNIEEGIPDLDLLWRLLKNPEEGFLGSFLGLPKESFTATFDPSGDFWKATMASRGRRGGAPAREDEPRRDERAEHQAPAPQGPVLPPPPPVDYGVFMQGLVQAMQTQAHTRQHSRHSWRLRKELMYGGLHCCIPGLRTELLMLLGTSS
ncbi:hypothetical protein Taro_016250 [Colocasia esculenta]|uniref:Uncharacterized protein n=1 Tax=Colocasia esculenta TaxID=4460 RepID=A0A843USE3_COLES|nr:hypothetical protein [Colocasia esculenta]